MLSTAILISLALGLSYVGVSCVRAWAERRQVMDVPNERSSHSRPTPRGGGLALVLVTLAGVWSYALLLRPDTSRLPLLAYSLGAALIAAAGWLDDLRAPAKDVRFAAHVLGALLVIGGVGYWDVVDLPFLERVSLGWLGPPLVFLWVVGLTNAYNFMDGVDGIAGGLAVVAGLGWALLGWSNGQPLPGVIGLLLAATGLGFLGHNWSPARIFMGDVASGFLGYTFAVLPLLGAESDPRLLLAGVLLLWPFLFDTVFTFLLRLARGENIFVAHRSHLYQRLVIAGHSHRFVTLLYTALALAGAALSYVWAVAGGDGRALAILPTPLLCLGLWLYVVREERRTRALPHPPTAVIAGNRFSRSSPRKFY